MKRSSRFGWRGLVAEGLRDHRGWPPLWRSPQPRTSYDVVIVGGGGHGLATAHYLASRHGITNVAVLERSWLGGGNTGRNTTVVRSNYFYPESVALYEMSMRLYESLSTELNFNIMLSQRGFLTLAHTRHDVELQQRWSNALQLHGIEAEFLGPEQVYREVPYLNRAPRARHPVLGGFVQRRGGVARHDAVAWAYARAADRAGVHIVQNCPVTGFTRAGSRITGVLTPSGPITAGTVVMAVSGHSSQLAQLAGFELPVTSYSLQAFVTEPLQQMLDTVVLSPGTGVYLSQSDKGELVVGGALDLYASYAQRGSWAVLEQVVAGVLELFPILSRVRLMRQWSGTVDVVHDSSPILGESPVAGLLLNCGWGTGGFKAIPAGGLLTAHHVATGTAHPIAAPFGLDRFRSGAFIDEGAASGIAH